MGTTYYYETEDDNGKFTAGTDEEALARMPKGCFILYKENDTKDGTPFIILYEK